MPPVAIAAGVGAVGSIAGAAISSSGAKKAAQTQANATNSQIAANNANQQRILGLSQPAIDRGNAAGQIYSGLLGAGGNPQAAQQALATYRGSSGYQDLLNTGLGAVNANAYARGTGDSGATLKALQQKGMAIADQNVQQYLGNLNTLIQTGNSAIGNVSGVATNTVQANNAALQAGADASGAASAINANNWSGALRNLASIGSNLASSYGGQRQVNPYGINTGPVGYGLNPNELIY